MKRLVLTRDGGIITGTDALSYLKTLRFQRAFIVTGGSSMKRTGVLDRAVGYLKESGCDSFIYGGIGKDPTIQEVRAGLDKLASYQPDVVIAIGGGSAMDAAKAMLLFYEFPDITFENVLDRMAKDEIPHACRTKLICVGSTSGTGSEVTRTSVITDPEKELKVPIITDCIRPDVAILDPSIVMTMPAKIAAETGMDALTHALEAYTNHNLDDVTEALCRGAVEGILRTLVPSCLEPTEELREHMHNYQTMAGIGFANVGLGMVHGIAHSFGAVFHLAHGLTNAIILPYVLTYNRQDKTVDQKLKNLSYHCKCEDIVDVIRSIRLELSIPDSFQQAGVPEEEFLKKFDLLVDHAMLGSTRVNPVPMTRESMSGMVKLVYYGK